MSAVREADWKSENSNRGFRPRPECFFGRAAEDSPAKVTVTLNDGSKVDRAKYYATGSQQAPMSAQQIKAKFDVCAAEAVDKQTAEKLYATLRSLGDLRSDPAFRSGSRSRAG
jgi:hypothetical protein